MSGAASKLRDVRKLSDARASLDLDIPVDQLPGLPRELIAGGAPLHVHVQFGREQGHMVAQVTLRGELELVCQRCMSPMSWRVDTSSPVLLIESESEADGAPAQWETYLAAEGRLSIEALAAEELMLALPIVPLHEIGPACEAGGGNGAQLPAPQAHEQVTARPFEDLRALLERGAKPKT
jgi:DUF177 domain-containing protein